MLLKNLKNLEEKLKKASKIKPQSERGIKIAAVIAEALREIGQDPVLVGGAAVEFYTEGGYSTQDIDMLAPGGEKLWNVMKELGFERRGKDFIHATLKIYIEFPGSFLEGSEKSISLDVDNIPLRIISVEDLIVDRLCAYKYWESAIDGINSLLLLEMQSVDEERLKAQAKKKDVLDALEAVREIYTKVYRKKLPKKKATQELENWLRNRKHV